MSPPKSKEKEGIRNEMRTLFFADDPQKKDARNGHLPTFSRTKKVPKTVEEKILHPFF
jgi:hypothetical protein